MPKFKWNPKKLRDEAKEWLERPMSKQMFWTDPRKDLDLFLDGALYLNGVLNPPGLVSFRVRNLGNWYANLAIAKHLDQPDEAHDHLIQYLQYVYISYQIMARANALDLRQQKQGKLSFNECGISLARLVALGYSSQADMLFQQLRLGLQNTLFYGLESTSVTPFVANLYAMSKGQAISFTGIELQPAAAYNRLVALLRSNNLEEIGSALEAACNFHVARSQQSDDEVDYEFDDDLDRIHPADILAFLRLRQELALPVPEINHPILANSFAKLHEPKPFPTDTYLDRVAEAADALLTQQERAAKG